jgi:hypothetical protein
MNENDPAAIKLVTEYTRYTRRQLSAFFGTTCLWITAGNSEDTAFRAHATASLFSIAGLHFLVTAAHIFDDDPPSLWAETVHGETVHGKVHGKRIRIDEHPRCTYGDIDLGFVYLRDDFVAALEGMRFLTMQDVELNIPPDGMFAICGFPQELNIVGKDLIAFGYTTVPYRGSTAGIDYNPKTQLLLEYNTSFSTGEGGTPAGMPDSLKGMSGCPVWLIDGSKHLEASALRVVGVQTSTVRVEGAPHRRIVKATRWEGVVACLVQLFPDLERVFNLHGIKIGRTR